MSVYTAQLMFSLNCSISEKEDGSRLHFPHYILWVPQNKYLLFKVFLLFSNLTSCVILEIGFMEYRLNSARKPEKL